MTRKWLVPTIICLFIGIAGADWLDGGSGNGDAGSWFADSGPDYGEIASWFSDPIFFSSSTSSLPPGFHEQHYLHFGKKFLRSPIQPIRLGGWRNNQASIEQAAIYPFMPTQSEFRNKSLASMEWPAFKKNWTQTLGLAKKSSSFKILKDRGWTNMR